MKKGIIALFVILLVGCSDNEPVNNTHVAVDEPNDVIATTVKSTPVKEEKLTTETTINFFVNKKNVEIDTKDIPILQYFLSTFENRQIGINTMTIKEIELDDIYLLSFNCNINNCSYILLDNNKPKRSILLDDFVQIKGIMPSPSKEEILIILEKNQSDYMIVFNLNEWAHIGFNPVLEEFGNVRLSNPEWNNETEFTVEIFQLQDKNTQQVNFTKTGKVKESSIQN